MTRPGCIMSLDHWVSQWRIRARSHFKLRGPGVRPYTGRDLGHFLEQAWKDNA